MGRSCNNAYPAASCIVHYQIGQNGRLQIADSDELAISALKEQVRALVQQGHNTLQVSYSVVDEGRSLNQNRLMWRLLHKMAAASDGGRLGLTKAEDCYMEMLEEHGVRPVYLAVPADAPLDRLQEAYPIVKVLEISPDGIKTIKCMEGSSCFTTKEMHDFIEAIFDRLADMEVDDPEIAQLGNDWRAWNG